MSSADGQQLAAETAKVVFTAAASLEEAQAIYQSQKAQAKATGRNPDQVVIMPGVMPIVGRTREEAKALWKELNTLVDIADDFQLWLEQGGADGFNIMPAIMPDQLDRFVELVIPELRRRGLFPTDYAYATLRENLGLPAI